MSASPDGPDLLQVDVFNELSGEDRDRLREKIIHGEEAAQVLNSEVFTAAFDALTRAIVTTWARSKPEETELREQLYVRQLGLKHVRDLLTNLMTKGKSAVTQLREAGEE